MEIVILEQTDTSPELLEWEDRYNSFTNYTERALSAKKHDKYVRTQVAPFLKKKGITYWHELSHSGTCYLYANGVRVRLSDHKIDCPNYDLQVLWPLHSDASAIAHFITRVDRREAIAKSCF